MKEYVKSFLFLIPICWILGAVSGCVGVDSNEYSSVSVEEIYVKPLSEEQPAIVREGTGIALNVTAGYINEKKESSSDLSLLFRVAAADSSREFEVKQIDLGPMKGRSMDYYSVQVTVPGPGMYSAEVGISEKGKMSSPTLGTIFTVEEDGNVTI